MSAAGRVLTAAGLATLVLACRTVEAGPTAPMFGAGTIPPPSCAADLDSDGDGWADRCEDRLAMAFAPVLMQHPDDCGWTRVAGTNLRIEFDGIAGGYFHAVQHVAPDRIRIAYLPAYVTDCGWHGAKCILPGVDCDAHAGDSEIVIVELQAVAGGWRPSGVFLSAHCFDDDSDDCRWYRDDDLDRIQRDGVRPVVWVSAGRHANYPSRRACERGHYHLDSCDADARPVLFPVSIHRNIGSARSPEACRPSAVFVARSLATHAECPWSGEPFRGWQADAPGVTPYLRYLDEIAGFVEPIDRLAWLAGCWERRTANSLSDEQWMAPRGGVMLGMGRLVRDGRAVSYEAMRIEARGDSLVFVANPSGQQVAEFVATSVDDDGVVFANPAHDFPQRVIYRHAAGDSLHARIEGVSDGEEQGIDFHMGRTRCGG